MNQVDIARYRLVSQQLAGTNIQTAHEMVAWFGAVQGQEYAQTKWGIGLRMPQLLDKDVEQELNEGKILRTHLLRPTWHFVNSQDIAWLLLLTAPRVQAVNATMYRKTDLDAKALLRYSKAIGKLLQGGKHLTRTEIAEALFGKRADVNGVRLAYIMMHAELEGIICSGPRRGSQFTYALLSERASNLTHLSRQEALHELTKRYFSSRGPATTYDFSAWSGLTLTECKQGVSMMHEELRKFTLDEQEYYFVQQSNSLIYKPKLLLLPEYDELIMGYKNRQALMRKFDVGGVLSVAHNCMMLYDGQIIGSYKRVLSGRTAHLDFAPFAPLNRTQALLLQQQLKRFVEFAGLKIEQ